MTKQITLTKGKTATVDTKDYEMLNRYNWCVSDGYAYNSALGRMHRYILGAPKGSQVDHINGDRLDNRRCNLRLCTSSQNQANRKVSRGVSHFKGVTYQKRPTGTGSWKAQIVVGGDVLFLGVFNTDKEAAAAYNAAAVLHFGEFAHLNDLSLPASSLVSTYSVRRQVKRDNPYGLKGVSFDTSRSQWTAQLTYKGVKHIRKRYPTAKEAALAYDEVARRIHGPHAVTNF